MEFDIPIRVTAFLYDLEKKLILFVGAVKVELDSEQGVAEVTATKGKAIEGFHREARGKENRQKRGRESFQDETRAGASCTATIMDKRLSQSPGTKPALTCDSTPSVPHCGSGRREKKTPDPFLTPPLFSLYVPQWR